MKVIITGGRKFNAVPHLDRVIPWLKHRYQCYEIDEVVSGGATGADEAGEPLALALGVPAKSIYPNWMKYGTRAGPIRNTAILDYAGHDAVLIAFPGGKGTLNMVKQALSRGMRVEYVTGVYVTRVGEDDDGSIRS